MNRRIVLSAAILGVAAIAPAQNVRQEVRVFQSQSSSEGGDHVFMVPHEKMSALQWVGGGHADGKSVRNAPYSGEVTTETTRVLTDGTRIVNRDTATVARDKEGRLRREASLGRIGPFAPQSAEMPRFVTITDPVSKEVYILNPNERTANKSKMGEPFFYRAENVSPNAKHVAEGTFEMKIDRRGSAGPGGAHTAEFVAGTPVAGVMAGPGVRVAFDSKNVKTEDLGTQNIEGVMARGTRTTHTIPAGQIGNDRDIVATTERWFSDELQITVLSKTNDPQFGETVYRVNNLRRAEPDPSLFRVPAEYKVNEAKPPVRVIKPDGGPDRI